MDNVILEGRGLCWSVRERRRALGRVREHRVLRDASLSLRAGEVVGLAGPSGVGKTTLGTGLLRLLPGCTGTVRWDGVDVSSWSERRLRPLRTRFQALLQSPQAMLTPFWTVQQHLEETLRELRGVRRPGPADWGGVVEELGLAEVLHSRPFEISGGEARRVGLARVLLARPAFLFADEPDAGLDPPRRVELARRIRGLARDGMAVLVVTHDRGTLKRLSDRLVLLDNGAVRSVEVGELEES